MASITTPNLIDEFLGSMHVLTAAIGDVMEEAVLDEVAAGQITVSQFKLLKLIARTETQTIGDVAAFLGVSNAAASKAADRLVRRRLLDRTEGRADRRAIVLSLTAAGHRLMRLYESVRNEKFEKIFKHFSTEELLQIAAAMERLAVSIVSQSANPEGVCLHCKMYFREKCLMRQFSPHDCMYERHQSRASERTVRTVSGAAGGEVTKIVPAHRGGTKGHGSWLR